MSVTVNESNYTVTINEATQTVQVASPGPAGQGVPTGGSTGQVLAKVDGTNYNTTWSSAGNGTVTSVTPQGDNGSGTAITSSGNIKVAGTAPISTTVVGDTITVTHDNATGSGTATNYPGAITVDAKGHVLSVGSSSTPLLPSNNLSDVTASTARSNLGLGTAAVVDTGTGSSNVILGNDARLTDDRDPNDHSADKVTSGTLSVDRIPALSTDKLTSGTLGVARGGTGLTSLSTLLNSNTTKSDVGLGNVTNIEAQPVDADLTAIAGLTSAADKGIQFTGSGSAGVYDLTAAGKALLDDADAAAQRTTLGLGTAATSATGDFSPVAGSGSIVTTGTIATGTWNATAIEDTKLDLRVDHGVTFDGQGSVIESAKVVLVPVERAGVIKAATLVGDASGAITITITKYDPAADATTLGSPSAVGTIALATKIINRDTTLSGWTLAVAEGDILAFTTGGTIATVTRVTCKLKLELA